MWIVGLVGLGLWRRIVGGFCDELGEQVLGDGGYEAFRFLGAVAIAHKI